MRFLLRFLIVFGFSFVLNYLPFTQTGALAAGFQIVKILDGGNRPDLACCVPFYIFYTPVISGNHVAFISRNGPPDGIWSGNINTKVLTKLAGLETPAPGGSGNFSGFFGGSETPISIGGGFVTFFATDAIGKLGLYSVPVRGGLIRRIASTALRAPDGQFFTSLRRAATNGTDVIFAGATSLHQFGIFKAPVMQQGRVRLIDEDTLLDGRTDDGSAIPDAFGIYSAPLLGQTGSYFVANGAFDPVTGPNAVVRGASGVIVADNATQLHGGSGGHVRISKYSAAAAGEQIAILADEPVTGYTGIFKVITRNYAALIASTKNAVPGQQRRFSQFLALSHDASGTAFVGVWPTSTGSQQGIYFVTAPGQAIQSIASGANYFLPLIGNQAVSNGRIVFMEGSNFADKVFVAVPQP